VGAIRADSPRPPAVTLRSVTKVYGGRTPVTALRDVSLEIARGALVAIQGKSGSGKSTLLNLMGGLDVPTSGSVIVAATDLAPLSETERSLFRRRQIAYVFQAYHLLPTLTCAQNVALPLHLQGRATREIDRQVAAVLEDVGLAGRADHVPDELSGGERQRVAIARALVTAPALLLADEPTGNLDSETAEQVLGLLRTLVEARQATLVMVTHDDRAAAECDRVIALRDGQIV
jgi:putative ABC transport system ATP-binding protein